MVLITICDKQSWIVFFVDEVAVFSTFLLLFRSSIIFYLRSTPFFFIVFDSILGKKCHLSWNRLLCLCITDFFIHFQQNAYLFSCFLSLSVGNYTQNERERGNKPKKGMDKAIVLVRYHKSYATEQKWTKTNINTWRSIGIWPQLMRSPHSVRV